MGGKWGYQEQEGGEYMEIEIKNRWDGSVIFSMEAESWKDAVEAAMKARINLSGSDLRGSDLSGSNLRGSNLSDCDLSGSNLSGSNLRNSNLSGSDLSGCNLLNSDLSGSEGINQYMITPLLLLLEQPGLIRAYKLVNENGYGPYNGGIEYVIGSEYNVENANTDETIQCAAGINLATLDWCMKNWNPGYRILIAEFDHEDIAAIPIATDGKFRCHRVKIVGEVDLVKIGLKRAINDNT